MIFQRIYRSKRPLNVDKFSLNTILSSSLKNNSRDGLTGILLSEGRQFFQVIEGAEQAVRTLYDRILDDDRHDSVVHIADRRLPFRTFPDWAMAFREIDAMDCSGGGCVELTSNTVMNELLKRAGSDLRDYVRAFLADSTPSNRGEAELFDAISQSAS